MQMRPKKSKLDLNCISLYHLLLCKSILVKMKMMLKKDHVCEGLDIKECKTQFNLYFILRH